MSAPTVRRGDRWVRVDDADGDVFGEAVKLVSQRRLYTSIRFGDCASMEIQISRGDLEIYTDLQRLSDLHAMLGLLIKEAKQLLKGD
jgi:hypothetical protein